MNDVFHLVVTGDGQEAIVHPKNTEQLMNPGHTAKLDGFCKVDVKICNCYPKPRTIKEIQELIRAAIGYFELNPRNNT